MCNYSEAIEEVKEAKAIAKINSIFTAQITEKIIAQVTENVISQLTGKITTQVTEKVTAQVTEKVTAQVTEKKDKETVINMLKEGLTLDVISRVTKLTYDQVADIGKKAMLL